MILENSTLFGNDVDGLTSGDANPGNGGGLHISADAVVNLVSTTTVSGNVAAAEGGGLWNSADGTINVGDDVVISGNSADGDEATQGGGGIYNDGGDLNIGAAVITGNFATGAAGSGGGILSVDGDLVLNGATISDNEASRAGGGIEIVDGSITADGVDFLRNVAGGDDAAPGNGGAVHVTGDADSSFTGGFVSNNVAANEGGGFWNQAGVTMTVDGTVFENNAAMGEDADTGGGAIYNNGGSLVVMNARFLSNTATEGAGSGGAILSVGGDVSVTGGVFNANLANRAGGAIEIAPGEDGDDEGEDGDGVTLTVQNARFTRNEATGGDDGEEDEGGPGNGGAIHVSGGDSDTTITDSYFALNVAATSAGAVWNNEGSEMDIDGSTFSTNRANGSDMGEGGGAVYNSGDLTVDGSVFFVNVAGGEAGSGGAIINPTGTLEVSNSTLRRNSAERAGGGVEIGTGEVTLTELLAVGNVAGISGDGAPGNGGAVHVTFDAVSPHHRRELRPLTGRPTRAARSGTAPTGT